MLAGQVRTRKISVFGCGASVTGGEQTDICGMGFVRANMNSSDEQSNPSKHIQFMFQDALVANVLSENAVHPVKNKQAAGG